MLVLYECPAQLPINARSCIDVLSSSDSMEKIYTPDLIFNYGTQNNIS